MNQYPGRMYDPTGTVYFDVDPSMVPAPFPMDGGPPFYGDMQQYDRTWDHRPRTKKRPFHGGSLDTQKEWERTRLCCFHLQGRCQYDTACRFSHEDDGTTPCQFEGTCKFGHSGRGAAPQQEGAVQTEAPTPIEQSNDAAASS